MAKANSTRRKAGPSLSPKPRPLALIQRAADEAIENVRQIHQELNAHPESVKAREPQERDRRLSQLRAAAAKEAKELPDASNPLIDNSNARDTVANVRTVLTFLEYSELVDHQTTEEAEEGRWHIHKWLVGTLEYADAQMERESEINRAVIAGLQGGEQP
jgi:hypothetical protein